MKQTARQIGLYVPWMRLLYMEIGRDRALSPQFALHCFAPGKISARCSTCTNDDRNGSKLRFRSCDWTCFRDKMPDALKDVLLIPVPEQSFQNPAESLFWLFFASAWVHRDIARWNFVQSLSFSPVSGSSRIAQKYPYSALIASRTSHSHWSAVPYCIHSDIHNGPR